jgi:uncharacterized protein with HEPN domain
MSARTQRDFLNDIRDAAATAIEFVGGRTLDEFVVDKKSCYAVARALEILGEAAKHIPQDLRDRHATIPWRSMAGIRDKLIHDYVSVDPEIVWRTVAEDLPPIIPKIEHVIAVESQ